VRAAEVRVTRRPLALRAGLLKLPALALGLSALPGCGGAAVGGWKGVCEVGVGADAFDMDVALDLRGGDGPAIEGEGGFSYNGYAFAGDVVGELDGDELVIDVFGTSAGYVVELRVRAEVDDEELDGICMFRDQSELLAGELLLLPHAR
jgi:hypothetical protein